MLCLIRELVVPRAFNAECFTVSSDSSNGPSNSQRAWLGGGSSTKRFGSITTVDLNTHVVTAQVLSLIFWDLQCASLRIWLFSSYFTFNLVLQYNKFFFYPINTLQSISSHFSLSLFHFVLLDPLNYYRVTSAGLQLFPLSMILHFHRRRVFGTNYLHTGTFKYTGSNCDWKNTVININSVSLAAVQIIIIVINTECTMSCI